jgi:hypothetical protein
VTDVYHITHLRNLPSILDQGGLCCDVMTGERDLDPVGIAHQHIKERRARRRVPLAAQGTLADYVPFYFAPRSPMLYAIHTNWVAGFSGRQGDILHLVAEAETIRANGLIFAFTDGHAEMSFSSFFEELADLERVDWQIMQETFWNDTAEDGDRKRRRQAEFLVHRFFPWQLIKEIGVISSQVAHTVQALLDAEEHKPVVSVRRKWYY